MRRLSIAEILDRSRQAILAKSESFSILNRLAQADAENCLTEKSGHGTLFSKLCDYLPLGGDPQTCLDRLNTSREELAELVSSAEMNMTGKFQLLGMEPLSFGRPINWHLDPTSGKISPLIHWKKLDNLSPELTGDKKVVWEVNRHQHLVLFARAFLHTGDARFVSAIDEHIRSWIERNPAGYGINWVSSLEIAFRCISWLWAIALIRPYDAWRSLPLSTYAKSLYEQGCHIERYLSTYSSPNTHLTGEGLALYYLGTCLPEMKRAKQWQRQGRTILLEQMEKQIYPDGVYFEQSTWYHRYTTDFYIHFYLLASRAADPLPSSVLNKINSLLEHMMWITRPDGSTPFIGDDDGGSLIKLDKWHPSDWRSTLSVGAVLFERGDFKYLTAKCANEATWLLGKDACKTFDDIGTSPPPTVSRFFMDSGYCIQRNGWTRTSSYLLFDCGPHGMMNCGHAHADALSIEITSSGVPILVDPGTYSYSRARPENDRFRMTSMHNTLVVDNQPSSIPSGPFKWSHIARTNLHYWYDQPSFSFAQASHDGYQRLADPVKHRRTMFYVFRDYWVMLDEIDAIARHELGIHFQMSNEANIQVDHARHVVSALSGRASLDIVFPEQRGKWNLSDGAVSKCYGNKVTAPHAAYTTVATGKTAVFSVLYPRQRDSASPVIQFFEQEQGPRLRIQNPESSDLVMWHGQEDTDTGIQESDFEWVCVRTPRNAPPHISIICINGSQLHTRNFEIRSDQRLHVLTASHDGNTLTINTESNENLHVQVADSNIQIVVNGNKLVQPVH